MDELRGSEDRDIDDIGAGLADDYDPDIDDSMEDKIN